jgi:uncharacterized protein YfaS (alpha-2-macroglobulin family)
MWPGGDRTTTNPWASVYATHFLVEANRHDFVVPPAVLTAALSHVAGLARSSERGWHDSWTTRDRLHTRAYAIYVLALAGQPERGAMDYLAQNTVEALSNAGRVHLAGAYGLVGNRQMLAQLLPARLAPALNERACGYTWHSPAREEAILLDVLATVEPEHAQIPILLGRLAERAKHGRWHNTQENGFALLALGKLIARGVTESAPGQVLVDGEVVAEFGGNVPPTRMGSEEDEATAEAVSVRSENWGGRKVEIRTTGPGLAYYSILDEGVPRHDGERHVNAGLHATRSYFDEGGRPVLLDQIAQGQIVVCRLALSSDKGTVENVVVSDLVPAGLEIENPRLVSQGGLAWIQQLPYQERKPLRQEYLEIRDDRLLLFTTATAERRMFFYGLRAVTAGDFILPPLQAEAMYDPDVHCVQDSGEVTIVAP